MSGGSNPSGEAEGRLSTVGNSYPIAGADRTKIVLRGSWSCSSPGLDHDPISPRGPRTINSHMSRIWHRHRRAPDRLSVRQMRIVHLSCSKMRARPRGALLALNMTQLLFNTTRAHDLRTPKHEGLYGRRCGRDACSVIF